MKKNILVYGVLVILACLITSATTFIIFSNYEKNKENIQINTEDENKVYEDAKEQEEKKEENKTPEEIKKPENNNSSNTNNNDNKEQNKNENKTENNNQFEPTKSIKLLLQEALNANHNLNEQEKSYFLKIENIIEDNKDIINLNIFLNKLKTIKIIYEQGANAKQRNAEYYMLENYIKCYNATTISSISDETITHEILHMLDETKTNNNPFFVETINTIFNNEYFGTSNNYIYDMAYCDQVNFMYVLIEIIGKEPVRKYQFKHDINFIKNELLKIINDNTKAENLINFLELHLKISQGELKGASISNLQENLFYMLNDYYKIKYNKTMENDLYMLLLTHHIDYYELCRMFGLTPMKNYYWNSYTMKSIKNYFNIKANNYKELSFSIPDMDKNGNYSSSKITINSENRYINI